MKKELKKELKKEFKEEILNEPIIKGKYLKSIYPTKEENNEITREIMIKEFLPRIEALYKEYDLPYEPEKYGHELACILATKYIFKPNIILFPKKKGRPQKWKGLDGISLFLRVNIKLLEKDGRSLREAIRIVMKKMNIPQKKLDTMYVRYNEVINNESIENIIVMKRIAEELSKLNDKESKIERLKQMLKDIEEIKEE